jgi:D-alanyl-D-alanine carboxypeptidase
LWGKNEDEVRDIASLTKMMTCFMTTQIVNEQLCDLETVVEVSRRASSMIGTSAKLREHDRLRVVDCLHAMMLPSGNDAAKALAENLGRLLKPRGSKEDDSEHFVKHMNLYARKLGLQNTHFSNPHGLAYRGNRSTTRDLGTVAACLLNDPVSREIVSCCAYTCRIVNNETMREVTWKNTNSLLSEDSCTGVKTGITPNAGPCLCASFMLEEGHIVVTILNCRTAERRWLEVKRLMEWARSKLRGLK